MVLLSVHLCGDGHREWVRNEDWVCVCVWSREGVISQDVSEVISFFSELSKVCHLAITPCQTSLTS